MTLILPLLILTSSSACHFASAYQITPKSINPRRSYGVISICEMHGGHSRKSTSGFGFGEGTRLGMYKTKSICTLNFYKLSQSTAEIIRLLKMNGRLDGIITSGFNFAPFSFTAMTFCLPNFTQIEQRIAELRRHVISIFQDDGQSRKLLLPSSFVNALI